MSGLLCLFLLLVPLAGGLLHHLDLSLQVFLLLPQQQEFKNLERESNFDNKLKDP